MGFPEIRIPEVLFNLPTLFAFTGKSRFAGFGIQIPIGCYWNDYGIHDLFHVPTSADVYLVQNMVENMVLRQPA